MMDESRLALLESQVQGLASQATQARLQAWMRGEQETNKPRFEEYDHLSVNRVRTIAETVTREVLADQPDSGDTGYGTDWTAKAYEFEGFANEARTGITLEPGMVRDDRGPTWYEFTEITNYDTAPAAVASDKPFLWVVFDMTGVSSPATMTAGTQAEMEAAISTADKYKKVIFPILATEWTGARLDKIRNMQCGTIKVSRGA